MARKRYKPEEIVSMLRQAEVLHGQGMSMADTIRQLGISEVTFYRWRKEYGGMSGGQLCRAVSDLTLDKQSLTGERMHATGPSACANARGNFFSIRGPRINAPLSTPRSGAASARLALLSEVDLRSPHDGVRGAGGSI